jgi:hypothetical protein
MKLDLRKFSQATNPAKTLFADNLADEQSYYINRIPFQISNYPRKKKLQELPKEYGEQFFE